MAGIGRYKLSDAIRRPAKAGGDRGGRPVPPRGAAVEQAREAAEGEKARSTGVSRRERMVDLGRGNQQAGRQGA